MMVRKNRVFLIFALVVSFCTAQKVNIKKSVVAINGQKIAKVEDDLAVNHSFYLHDLQHNKLLYFKWIYVEYKNESHQSTGNSKSELNYFEVYHPDDLLTILYEEEAFIRHKQHLIKNLYNANALDETGLNEDKLNIYAQKMGKQFSRLRGER